MKEEMAKYCWQCAETVMGVFGSMNDFKDIAKDGKFVSVTCAGCGEIEVDSQGRCHSIFSSEITVGELMRLLRISDPGLKLKILVGDNMINITKISAVVKGTSQYEEVDNSLKEEFFCIS